MADESQGGAVATDDQPTEEQLRAAYEAELSRIASSDMILQTVVSLINIGGNRLGLVPSGGSSRGDQSAAGSSPAGSSPPGAERDLEQARDAIDGASALLPILERRMPRELGPLRDAIAQLQVAYAREAQSAANAGSAGSPQPSAEQAKPAAKQDGPAKDTPSSGPGPAEASGRLWVPGR